MVLTNIFLRTLISSFIPPCWTSHQRRFFPRSEIKEMLTKYKEQLQKEIEGVDERISELSKKEA
jgi:hypothetical protein